MDSAKSAPAPVPVQKNDVHANAEGPQPVAEQEAFDRWAWDLCGYLVIPGAMEDEWCDKCLEALNANKSKIKDRTHHRTFPRDHAGSDKLGSRALIDLLALPAPHSQPFARMVANPTVLQRVVWMLGGRARVNYWGRGEVIDEISNGLVQSPRICSAQRDHD